MENNAIRNAIACALFNCTNRERQFAAEYIELNPAEKERRKRLAYEKTPKHLKGIVNYYVG